MTVPQEKLISSLVVRPLAPDDAEAVAELNGQLGYASNTRLVRERLKDLSRGTGRIAFAALLHGELVGWIEASIEHHLQSPACVVIGGLIVREAFRGNGIGEILCREVEQWTMSNAIETLRVRSQIAREEAHRFYLMKGFRKIKTSLVFEKMLHNPAAQADARLE